MQIIKMINMVLCIIPGSMAIYYYLKIRRLLNENSDDELDEITPELRSLMRKLSVVLCVFVAILAIHVVLLIVEFILKIL